LLLVLSVFICVYPRLDVAWFSWRLGGSIIVLVFLGGLDGLGGSSFDLAFLGGSAFDLIRVHPCSSVVSIESWKGLAAPVISEFSVADAVRNKKGRLCRRPYWHTLTLRVTSHPSRGTRLKS
jgi:hypothetical protein